MKNPILGVMVAGGLVNLAIAQEPVWDGNSVVLESQKLVEGGGISVNLGAITVDIREFG